MRLFSYTGDIMYVNCIYNRSRELCERNLNLNKQLRLLPLQEIKQMTEGPLFTMIGYEIKRDWSLNMLIIHICKGYYRMIVCWLVANYRYYLMTVMCSFFIYTFMYLDVLIFRKILTLFSFMM